MLQSRSLNVLLASLVVGACADSTRPTAEMPQIALRREFPKEGRGSPRWTIDDEFEYVARYEVPGFGGSYFDEEMTPTVWLTNPGQRAAR